MIHIAYALADGLFISIFSIVIVFLILLLISVVIQSLQRLKEKPKLIEEPVNEKILSIEDITDEDMMVAALVASIDYQKLTKGDVKVTSIKETN